MNSSAKLYKFYKKLYKKQLVKSKDTSDKIALGLIFTKGKTGTKTTNRELDLMDIDKLIGFENGKEEENDIKMINMRMAVDEIGRAVNH